MRSTSMSEFELNPNFKILQENLEGSPIFCIDDFYLKPEEVKNYLFSEEPPLWKIEQKPSNNGVMFEDRRLCKRNARIFNVIKFLSELCKQEPLVSDVLTNMTRFVKDDFNNYTDNVWWPHRDEGYNAIVYFNENCECGTNLYENCGDTPPVPEHYQPWRPKEKYKFIDHLAPKYNRMVLFNGNKFVHGANICNDRYFSDEYRCNQVFFFTDKYKQQKNL